MSTGRAVGPVRNSAPVSTLIVGIAAPPNVRFELHEADRIGPPSDHPKYLGNPRKSNLFGESGPEPENDLVGIGEAVQTADYKVSIYILRASSSLSALTRLPFNVFPERLPHFPPALEIVERSQRAKAKVIA